MNTITAKAGSETCFLEDEKGMICSTNWAEKNRTIFPPPFFRNNGFFIVLDALRCVFLNLDKPTTTPAMTTFETTDLTTIKSTELTTTKTTALTMTTVPPKSSKLLSIFILTFYTEYHYTYFVVHTGGYSLTKFHWLQPWFDKPNLANPHTANTNNIIQLQFEKAKIRNILYTFLQTENEEIPRSAHVKFHLANGL